MKHWIASLCVAAALGGCATYDPVPKDYTGPVAVVADTGLAESGSKAQMFALISVDGNTIDNAFWASRRKSSGQGPNLTPVYTERNLPVRPMKVVIQGSHATGAPIHELASRAAGTFFSVEGPVDFLPEAGRRYMVRGELSKARSSVWIEDAVTGKPVTAVVSTN